MIPIHRCRDVETVDGKNQLIDKFAKNRCIKDDDHKYKLFSSLEFFLRLAVIV